MRRLIYWINRRLPFGFLPIARVTIGKETATLYRNGWVVISDGKSTDALPITFCSPAVSQAFVAELGGKTEPEKPWN